MESNSPPARAGLPLTTRNQQRRRRRGERSSRGSHAWTAGAVIGSEPRRRAASRGASSSARISSSGSSAAACGSSIAAWQTGLAAAGVRPPWPLAAAHAARSGGVAGSGCGEKVPQARPRALRCVRNWRYGPRSSTAMSLRSPQAAAATDWTPPSHRESERVTGQARMAAVSGGVFAVLLVVALVLVETGPKLDDPDSRYTSFYTNGSGGTLVTLGVYVVPFAGIAFLWHVVATRTLLQVLRPGSWADPAHWLQLASGLVFVCMLFGASAAVGAVALLTRFSVHPLPPPDVARSLSAVGYGLAFVFGVRAAGMYMIA